MRMVSHTQLFPEYSRLTIVRACIHPYTQDRLSCLPLLGDITNWSVHTQSTRCTVSQEAGTEKQQRVAKMETLLYPFTNATYKSSVFFYSIRGKEKKGFKCCCYYSLECMGLNRLLGCVASTDHAIDPIAEKINCSGGATPLMMRAKRTFVIPGN